MVVNLVGCHNKIDQFFLALLFKGVGLKGGILGEVVHDGEAEVVVERGAVYYDLELGEDEDDEPWGGVGGTVAGEGEIEGPLIGLADA